MEKVYSRINWENEPSARTPLNASNLNSIDYALNEADNRIISLDGRKANQTDMLQSLKGVSYDQQSGVFIFMWQNGSTFRVDMNIEKIPISFELSQDGILTMINADGSQYVCDIASLIKTYNFKDSSTLDFEVDIMEDGSHSVEANIKIGSISRELLNPDYLSAIDINLAEAQMAASSAKSSENTAVECANRAEVAAEKAETVVGFGIATAEKVGIVKPDGISIKIKDDGTLFSENASNDYNDQIHKPTLNGIELKGDLTSVDVSLQPAGDYPTTGYMMDTMSQMYSGIEVDFATKVYVAEQVAAGKLKKKIVSTLPTTGIDQDTIYLVPKPSGETTTNDIYNEYINLTGTTSGWEFLGSTAIDLAEFYNKTQCNNLFATKSQLGTLSSLTTTDKGNLVAAINEINSDLANVNNYSTTEQVIGKWIDGRIIYRKVVSAAIPASITGVWTRIVTLPNDVKNIINVKGFSLNGYPFPYADSSFQIGFHHPSNYINIIGNTNNLAGIIVYFVVEYMK